MNDFDIFTFFFIQLQNKQIVVISLTASVALLTVLARYLGRRKISHQIRRTRRMGGRRTRNSMRSPNGKKTNFF